MALYSLKIFDDWESTIEFRPLLEMRHKLEVIDNPEDKLRFIEKSEKEILVAISPLNESLKKIYIEQIQKDIDSIKDKFGMNHEVNINIIPLSEPNSLLNHKSLEQIEEKSIRQLEKSKIQWNPEKGMTAFVELAYALFKGECFGAEHNCKISIIIRHLELDFNFPVNNDWTDCFTSIRRRQNDNKAKLLNELYAKSKDIPTIDIEFPSYINQKRKSTKNGLTWKRDYDDFVFLFYLLYKCGYFLDWNNFESFLQECSLFMGVSIFGVKINIDKNRTFIEELKNKFELLIDKHNKENDDLAKLKAQLLKRKNNEIIGNQTQINPTQES